MSVQEANKQICRDYFKAFLARDTAWMAKHIAPDFVRHDPGLPFEVRGPQGVAALHDALLLLEGLLEAPEDAVGLHAGGLRGRAHERRDVRAAAAADDVLRRRGG